jgi:Enoyl-(Acyl carrier protein) reductase
MPAGSPVTYGSAKGALTTLGKSLAEEFGPRGVRVSTISPGMVRTTVTTGRMTEAAEVAALIAFLLSDVAGNITGAEYVIDGGMIKTVLAASLPVQASARPLEELESALDEVLVELEHPAVPGVGIEDELAVWESLVEVDAVLGGHHLVALTVHDEHRLVDAREVRGLLLTPAVDGLQLGTERA